MCAGGVSESTKALDLALGLALGSPNRNTFKEKLGQNTSFFKDVLTELHDNSSL